MTAGVMLQDRDDCLQAGMDDYVPKPFSQRAVAEALQRWLPKEEARIKE